MNILEILVLLMCVAFIFTLAVLIIDYNQHKKNSRAGYLVILRINNHRIRQAIKSAGITMCWCAAYPEHNMLMFAGGDMVCGLNEDIEHSIEKARKNNDTIIDCGVSLKKFIYEVKFLQGKIQRCL